MKLCHIFMLSLPMNLLAQPGDNAAHKVPVIAGTQRLLNAASIDVFVLPASPREESGIRETSIDTETNTVKQIKALTPEQILESLRAQRSALELLTKTTQTNTQNEVQKISRTIAILESNNNQ